MTELKIDQDVCFGSGECVLAAPEVFDLDQGGIAYVRADAPPIADDFARRIADNCPSRAISIIEGTGVDPSMQEGEVR